MFTDSVGLSIVTRRGRVGRAEARPRRATCWRPGDEPEDSSCRNSYVPWRLASCFAQITLCRSQSVAVSERQRPAWRSLCDIRDDPADGLVEASRNARAAATGRNSGSRTRAHTPCVRRLSRGLPAAIHCRDLRMTWSSTIMVIEAPKMHVARPFASRHVIRSIHCGSLSNPGSSAS